MSLVRRENLGEKKWVGRIEEAGGGRVEIKYGENPALSRFPCYPSLCQILVSIDVKIICVSRILKLSFVLVHLDSDVHAGIHYSFSFQYISKRSQQQQTSCSGYSKPAHEQKSSSSREVDAHSICRFSSLRQEVAERRGEREGLKGGMKETRQAVAPLEGRADLLC